MRQPSAEARSKKAPTGSALPSAGRSSSQRGAGVDRDLAGNAEPEAEDRRRGERGRPRQPPKRGAEGRRCGRASGAGPRRPRARGLTAPASARIARQQRRRRPGLVRGARRAKKGCERRLRRGGCLIVRSGQSSVNPSSARGGAESAPRAPAAPAGEQAFHRLDAHARGSAAISGFARSSKCRSTMARRWRSGKAASAASSAAARSRASRRAHGARRLVGELGHRVGAELAPAAQPVDAEVAGDAVEPGAERRPAGPPSRAPIRQSRSIVSCVTSSASAVSPSIRRASAKTRGAWRAVSARAAAWSPAA